MAEDRSESPFSQPGDQVQLLLGRTELLLQKQRNSPRQRLVVALAGVPGSGKSTVAAALLKSLQDRGEQDVAILSMVSTASGGRARGTVLTVQDGFHHTKEALSRFDCPVTAFSRRGAPFTFDGEKFATFMETVKSSEVTLEEDPELALRAPSFDHAIQDPVAKDVYISSKCKLVIVEGNYVLLDLAPWSRVAELANETQVYRRPSGRRMTR